MFIVVTFCYFQRGKYCPKTTNLLFNSESVSYMSYKCRHSYSLRVRSRSEGVGSFKLMGGVIPKRELASSLMSPPAWRYFKLALYYCLYNRLSEHSEGQGSSANTKGTTGSEKTVAKVRAHFNCLFLTNRDTGKVACLCLPSSVGDGVKVMCIENC